jgi:DNA mismatch repair protein MutS2
LEVKESKLSARWRRLKSERAGFRRARRVESARQTKDAEAFLKQLRREADEMLAEMRESGDIEEAKKAARDKIRDLTARADAVFPAIEEPRAPAAAPNLRPGDAVRLRGSTAGGVVRSLNGGDTVTVDLGGKSLRLAAGQLERVVGARPDPEPRVIITHDVSAPSEAFSAELHVRGMRLEEALERVDKYIDDAAVLGVRSLRIVHGKGEGVLSGAIAKLLEGSFLVASYGTARPEEGGWGVTTVEMAGQSKSSGGVS